jgi:hypothetical protein
VQNGLAADQRGRGLNRIAPLFKGVIRNGSEVMRIDLRACFWRLSRAKNESNVIAAIVSVDVIAGLSYKRHEKYRVRVAH